MKILFIFGLLFSSQSFGNYILKVKSNKALIKLEDLDSELLLRGDYFSILDNNGNAVGTGRLLKTGNGKAIIKFSGKARKGFQIISKNSRFEEFSDPDFSDSQRKLASSSNITHISSSQYALGGVVGTVLGIGIGHAIQKRYSKLGWAFTVSQLLSGLMWGLSKECSGYYTVTCQRDDYWLWILIGFRVWEIIDVWWLPSSYKIGFYENNKLSISPTVYSYNKQERFAFGLNFRFKF